MADTPVFYNPVLQSQIGDFTPFLNSNQKMFQFEVPQLPGDITSWSDTMTVNGGPGLWTGIAVDLSLLSRDFGGGEAFEAQIDSCRVNLNFARKNSNIATIAFSPTDGYATLLLASGEHFPANFDAPGILPPPAASIFLCPSLVSNPSSTTPAMTATTLPYVMFSYDLTSTGLVTPGPQSTALTVQPSFRVNFNFDTVTMQFTAAGNSNTTEYNFGIWGASLCTFAL